MRPTAKECIRVTGEVSDGLLDGYRSGAKSRRQIDQWQAYRSPVSSYFDRRRYSPCAVDSWVARSGSEPPSSLSAADEGGALELAIPQGMEV